MRRGTRLAHKKFRKPYDAGWPSGKALVMLVSRGTSVRIRFRSPCGLWTLSCDFVSHNYETLKWLSSLPILMQELLWWWQCSDRYIVSLSSHLHTMGAGMAQWLERRTRDWKVAGSNPCWNGGRIFFSRVDFLCWLLFRYPFHPRVTAVARKKSRSFCQKCRCQVTAKHAYTLRMWILLNRASALVTTCP